MKSLDIISRLFLEIESDLGTRDLNLSVLKSLNLAVKRLHVKNEKEFKEYTNKEKIQACFLHAALRHESDKNNPFMTNSTLRERFGLDKSLYTMVSSIITETIEAGLIKPIADGTRKYAPFYA